jgi:hypothetical protein
LGFVRRRIGANWEYIRRLAERLALARRDLDLLNSELRANAELNQTYLLGFLTILASMAAFAPMADSGGNVLAEAWPDLNSWWCNAISHIGGHCLTTRSHLGPYHVLAGNLYLLGLIAFLLLFSTFLFLRRPRMERHRTGRD